MSLFRLLITKVFDLGEKSQEIMHLAPNLSNLRNADEVPSSISDFFADSTSTGLILRLYTLCVHETLVGGKGIVAAVVKPAQLGSPVGLSKASPTFHSAAPVQHV